MRQGEPLSCLLFNLAIELLAEMLCQPNLQGFQIPRASKCLLVFLFADDTTVFLSEGDNFQTLQDILDQWCADSGAKFNISKTKIIPL